MRPEKEIFHEMNWDQQIFFMLCCSNLQYRFIFSASATVFCVCHPSLGAQNILELVSLTKYVTTKQGRPWKVRGPMQGLGAGSSEQ